MTNNPTAGGTTEGVAAVDRALKILSAFRSGDDALSLAVLAARTGLVKSTILRLIISLERYGFVVRTVDGRYAMGGEILRLASAYTDRLDISGEVQPVLQFLAAKTEESASFWVMFGERRLCLLREKSPLDLRVEVQPGTVRSLDGTSAATILARYANVDCRLADMPSQPIYSSGKGTPHVASISAAVVGQNGRLLGSLTLSGPQTRLNMERAAQIGPLFMQAAFELSRQLGGFSSSGVANQR